MKTPSFPKVEGLEYLATMLPRRASPQISGGSTYSMFVQNLKIVPSTGRTLCWKTTVNSSTTLETLSTGKMTKFDFTSYSLMDLVLPRINLMQMVLVPDPTTHSFHRQCQVQAVEQSVKLSANCFPQKKHIYPNNYFKNFIVEDMSKIFNRSRRIFLLKVQKIRIRTSEVKNKNQSLLIWPFQRLAREGRT